VNAQVGFYSSTGRLWRSRHLTMIIAEAYLRILTIVITLISLSIMAVVSRRQPDRQDDARSGARGMSQVPVR
jgi:hypothetical protein